MFVTVVQKNPKQKNIKVPCDPYVSLNIEKTHFHVITTVQVIITVLSQLAVGSLVLFDT